MVSRRSFLGLGLTGTANVAMAAAGVPDATTNTELANAAAAKSRIDLSAAWSQCRSYVSRYISAVPKVERICDVVTTHPAHYAQAAQTWVEIVGGGEAALMNHVAAHERMFGKLPTWADMLPDNQLSLLQAAGLKPEGSITQEGLKLLRGINHDGLLRRAEVMSQYQKIAGQCLDDLTGKGYNANEAKNIVTRMLENVAKPKSDFDYLYTTDAVDETRRLAEAVRTISRNPNLYLSEAVSAHAAEIAKTGVNANSYLDKWFENARARFEGFIQRVGDDKVFIHLGTNEEQAKTKLGAIAELIRNFPNVSRDTPFGTPTVPKEMMSELHVTSIMPPDFKLPGDGVVPVPTKRYDRMWGVELDASQFRSLNMFFDENPNLGRMLGLGVTKVQPAAALG